LILAELNDQDFLALVEQIYDWKRWARPAQLAPPGDWFIWLIQSGRGWGKTRTAAEFVRSKIDTAQWRVVHCAAPTWMDVWSTMVEGSEDAPGLLGVWPAHQRPVVVRSENDPHLRCHNGAVIRLRAAKQADRFRGPQADGGWCDEIDSWKPDTVEPKDAFSVFELGIRLGPDPRIVVTSTPKPRGLVKYLSLRSDCHVTRGSSYDNKGNLSTRFLRVLDENYTGTRIGRQEIQGEILEDADGTLWTQDTLERCRATVRVPEYVRLVIAVDPAASAEETSNETGIVAAATDGQGEAHVLDDRSGVYSPADWAKRAIAAYHEYEADLIVAEKNNGGDMVKYTIHSVDPSVPVKLVTATRGKVVRAEPIAAKYEQGKVHHVGKNLQKLEDQLSLFTSSGFQGDGSPDRADAAVWALTELMLGDWGWDELSQLLPSADEEEEKAA